MEEANMQPATSANAQNAPLPQVPPSSISTTSSVAASPTEYHNAVRYSTARRDVSKSSSSENSPPSYANSVGRQSSFGSNSTTEVDTDLNEAMAETWSARTHVGSECDAVDQCLAWRSTLLSFHALDSLPEATAESYSPFSSQPQSHLGTVARRSMLSDLPPSRSDPGTVEIRHGTPFDLSASRNPYDETISSTGSDTLVNPVLNEAAWSETTLQESGLELNELGYLGTGPSRDDTANCTVPWSKGHLQKLGIHSPLERYQAEDPGEAPMTIFSLRTSGTTCAFCGIVFTGPDHKKMSINHTSEKHVPTLQTPMTAKIRPVIHPRRLLKFSDAATIQTSLSPSSPLGATDKSATRPISLPLKLASDLNAIGTKWQDELRLRKNAAATIVSTVSFNDGAQFTTSRDPKDLLDRFLALPDTPTSHLDTERLNDFLNGLDLVTRDLLRHFPKNETVRGLQGAIASMGPVSSLNPHLSLSKTVTSTLHTQTGVKSCPTPQHEKPPSGSLPSSDSSTSQQLGETGSHKPKDNDSFQADTNAAGQTPTVCLQNKKKKPRKRFLACPVKKNRELRNDTSPCRHTGSDNMSDLQKHLISRDHSESFPFVRLCRACWEYIINEKVWREYHTTKQCIQQTGVTKQVRGSRVAEQWTRLYGRMFPQSQRIPSPYVDDPTSLPKASSSHLMQPEPSVQNGGPNFDFNDPHSACSYAQDVSFRQILATPYSIPAPVHSRSGQIAHRPILESIDSILTNNSLQHPTVGHQFPNISPAFLDHSLATANNQVQPTSGLTYTQIPSNWITATEPPYFSNHDNGFSVYYSNAPDLQNLDLQRGSSLTNNSVHSPGMQQQPRYNTSDRSQTAAQRLMYELLEELIENRNPEVSATLAQRISHINGGTLADCEALGFELMARIHVLAEQRRSRPMPGVGIDAFIAAYNPITPTANEQHSVESSPLLPDMPLFPLGSSEEDLYNPATLENMGTSFWETRPDPTQRSFFPDLDLTVPTYVPT